MESLVLEGIGATISQLVSNADLYNWNRLTFRYCDGALFTGIVEAVNLTTKLYFCGAIIWHAVMEDLLLKGMKNAKNALLSECSAGGLSSIAL